MSTFVKGSLLLIVASFLGECVEFIMNMVLAKELGEQGLGLYMSILPTVFLIVLLASFELPISISKFIAERDSKYHRHMLKTAIHLTIVTTAGFMVLFLLLMPFLTMFQEYHPLFKWLVMLLIPLISFSSITRGFFMGKNQMGKIALANFLRKFVQLGLLVFLFQLFEFDTQTSIMIAFFTFVGSEVVIFLYLIHMFYIQFQQLKRRPSEYISGKVVRKNLISVSIPTTSIRVFHSLTHAIQPFLIKAALLHSGVSATVATEQFGLIAGVAMSIGFFPAFIAHSLLIVLIPTVSKAYAERDMHRLQELLRQVMGFTFLYGIPIVLVFYFFAEPLTNLFLHSPTATGYLQILIPYFLLHFFVIPLQAYLIGLGLLKDAFLHNIWSTIISFSLMYILGSMDDLRMDGVIIGMNTGAVLLTLMHYMTICKKIGVSYFSLRNEASHHF
ncbi:polysaccharide biosynthesis protein [Robertmurraya yapensis]|uniref:Polysaccharide biosynthesis protein n=2 Tax=Bacillaceae TaxID=186817 RepID=A0A3S0RIN4_9BACI|nr:polysaccharide biosynthesis protein [Bacillus yapensis]RTR29229.1 polysaccharide biosynthesis protein [Bacillus yapensis]TKS94834.1 polysaccharide biosynthesis protein [Bacillus yapensis]